MKGTDKYLIGIVVGIVLLVAVTVIVVLTRSKPEYRTDDTPEAVVHNYLLALEEGEYERAYGYLSLNMDAYLGDVEAFIEDVEDNRWQFGQGNDSALNVRSSRVTGERATVEVSETVYYSDGLFDSGQSEREFDMKLRLENGLWKLVNGDRYWYSCWSDDSLTWCDR